MAEHISYIALRDERPSSGDEGDALRKEDTASFESKTDDSETPRSSLDEPPVQGKALCRICFDTGPLNEMISPCDCTGTQSYVHPTCLNKWQAHLILRAASRERGADPTRCEG